MNRDEFVNINKLKNYFEEYLRSGMCQYEAPFIGRNDVITMLKVFKALDKACDELNALGEIVPMSKWPFDNETCKRYMDILDEEECINIWKEWLLKND